MLFADLLHHQLVTTSIHLNPKPALPAKELVANLLLFFLSSCALLRRSSPFYLSVYSASVT